MKRCPICRHWFFEHQTHICPPRWLIRLKNDHVEDAKTIFAKTAADAAADYVERVDENFSDFTENETVLVTPWPDDEECDRDTLPWQTYFVTGELIRTYSAQLKTQEAPDAG